MAKGFQQTCRNEHGNFLRFKAEKPRCLSCVEPCWNNLPTEKFCLLRGHIHTLMAARRLGRGEWVWVCFSVFFLLVCFGRISFNLVRCLVLGEVESFLNLALSAAQLLEAIFALKLYADLFPKFLDAFF